LRRSEYQTCPKRASTRSRLPGASARIKKGGSPPPFLR
jgi:hypothetical protein